MTILDALLLGTKKNIVTRDYSTGIATAEEILTSEIDMSCLPERGGLFEVISMRKVENAISIIITIIEEQKE